MLLAPRAHQRLRFLFTLYYWSIFITTEAFFMCFFTLMSVFLQQETVSLDYVITLTAYDNTIKKKNNKHITQVLSE